MVEFVLVALGALVVVVFVYSIKKRETRNEGRKGSRQVDDRDIKQK